MKIYRDIINNDELCSDIFPIELISDGTVYKVKGKLVDESFQFDDSKIGANASAEGADEGEGADASTSSKGVNICLNHKLQTLELSKKDFKATIGKYMKVIKERLEKSNPDEVQNFQKGVAAFIKDVLANYSDYQLWFGEQSPLRGYDTMPCLMLWDSEDIPWMHYFKHGLEEEKV